MERPTYHHGDLRRALMTEALSLARTGGPDAVTVREVARRLGVSPAAIYRHFPDRDALLGTAAAMARRELARRMLGEVGGITEREPRMRSIRRFEAIGRGYILFAGDEPNLLATAFLPIAPADDAAEGTTDGASPDPSPWHVLADALDELVATGAMPASRRSGAETIAWSAVHGFSVLRSGRAFDVSGEPDAQLDPGPILDAIARALELRTR